MTPNGQITDVPMPTDPNSGDTGFDTGTGGFVDDIATDPKGGRFLYTLDVQTSSFGIPIGENGIGAFTVNRTTGELTRVAGSPYKVSFRGGSVAEDGNGVFLFVAGTNANTVDTYSIDQTSGALTKTMSLNSSAGDQLSASWDGRFLFNGGNGQVVSYSIASNGALTQISAVPVQNVGPIFLSYSGKFIYSVSNNGITAISVSNAGQLTVTQASFTATQVAGGLPRRTIATSRDDRFAFMGTSAANNIGSLQSFSVDPTTGAIGNPIGSPTTFAVGQVPLQITLDFSGKFLYFTFTGINLQTSAVNADGTLGAPVINPGQAGNGDFFELSP
ncbi:MAG TPA: beta-propeller fold lactonase family protein [Bacteroidota bacterium]|nr:beta-propeller fold lactonase family protein [Bacteroidota bacterium]